MTELTHEELTRLLDYNPETGEFTWKVGQNKGKKAGTKGRNGKIIGIIGKKFMARNLAYFYVHKKHPDRGCYNVNGDICDDSIKNIEQYPEKPEELTQEYLKKLFYYNPETGEFKRKTPSSNNKVGDDAFSISKDRRRLLCRTSIMSSFYQTNRLIVLYMTGFLPSAKTHIVTLDNNCLNMKWGNLSVAGIGLGSRKGSVYNKIGLKGICKNHNKYLSKIRINGRSIYLGSFGTAKEAHEAYVKAAKKYFGDTHNDGFNHTMHHLEYEEVEAVQTLEETAPIEEAEPVEHEVDF